MTTAAERLDELFDDDIDGVSAEDYQRFQVTDLGSADWVMRKVAKLDAERREILLAAEHQIQLATAWQEAEIERLQQKRGHWESLLATYHRHILEKDKKAKTIHLAHGTLTARKQPDNVQIPDPDEVLEWAKDQGNEFVRVIPVKYELDRSAIKEAVLKNGEIIPGVTPVAGEVRFLATTEESP